MTAPTALCRCGTPLPYADCCGRFHGGEPARTAEELMRARFSAFALGLKDYLLETWHPSTRPPSLDLDDETRWRRLQIVDTVAGGPDEETGIVEFRASFRSPGGDDLVHERSRFTRVDGRWKYVDGDVLGT